MTYRRYCTDTNIYNGRIELGAVDLLNRNEKTAGRAIRTRTSHVLNKSSYERILSVTFE